MPRSASIKSLLVGGLSVSCLSLLMFSESKCEAATVKFPETCPIDDPLGKIKYDDLERSNKVKRATGLVKKYSCATYRANSPIEDRYDYLFSDSGDDYVAVFDGHGGWQAAEFAKKNLISNAQKEIEAIDKGDFDAEKKKVEIQNGLIRSFERTDRDLLVHVRRSFSIGFGSVARVGSCALVAFIRDGTLFVANAGDVRAVLGQETSDGMVAKVMSDDHNAKHLSEQLRLAKEHPGEDDIVRCKHPEACYVKGRLQPTRSLGDFYLKHSEFNGPEYKDGDRSRGRHIPAPYTPPYIHATPEIKRHQLTSTDKFLIIGSDGVWDFLSNEEAVKIVQESVEAGDAIRASEAIVQRVLELSAKGLGMELGELISMPAGRDRRRRHDDTTAVVVFF